MQLTINQTEIEDAIKTHIAEMINIEEGSEVVVLDFKAGRGDDGLTAKVYIGLIGSAPAAPVKGTKPTKATSPATEGVKRRGRPPKAATAPVETMGQAEESVEVPVEEASNDAVVQEGVAVNEAEAQNEPIAEVTETASAVEEAAPAPVKKSLFGGLQKPTNAAPAE